MLKATRAEQVATIKIQPATESSQRNVGPTDKQTPTRNRTDPLQQRNARLRQFLLMSMAPVSCWDGFGGDSGNAMPLGTALWIFRNGDRGVASGVR
jgi:hypothetical protein